MKYLTDLIARNLFFLFWSAGGCILVPSAFGPHQILSLDIYAMFTGAGAELIILFKRRRDLVPPWGMPALMKTNPEVVWNSS